MQPQFNTTSIELSAAMIKKENERMARMIRQARPVVDTSPPKAQPHLDLKLKKILVEEERIANIDRDNRLLLDKINRTNATAGGIDTSAPRHTLPVKQRRLREIARIMHQNQAIMKRLGAIESTLNNRDREKEYEAHRQYLMLTSKQMPPRRMSRHKHTSQFDPTVSQQHDDSAAT
jgi:hypothetical protein